MTWIIFGNLHDIARDKFHLGTKKITINEIDAEKVKKDLIDNLQIAGYEDMYIEFTTNNNI